MKTFWITFAVTLIGGWMLLNLMNSYVGEIGLLLIAAAAAALITALLHMHRKIADLEQRLERLEEPLCDAVSQKVPGDTETAKD